MLARVEILLGQQQVRRDKTVGFEHTRIGVHQFMLAETRQHLFLANGCSKFQIEHFTRNAAAGTDSAR